MPTNEGEVGLIVAARKVRFQELTGAVDTENFRHDVGANNGCLKRVPGRRSEFAVQFDYDRVATVHVALVTSARRSMWLTMASSSLWSAVVGTMEAASST